MRRILERALRGFTAASVAAARKARALRTRLGPGRAPAPGPDGAPPRARPEDTAFLAEVSETLRRIGTSGDEGPAPAPAPAPARLRTALAALRRLRERLRRHEDALLAAALLAGILLMVVHWRMSGTVRAPAAAPRAARGADAVEVRPGIPAEREGPSGARVGAADAAGEGARLGLPR